jgi:hypothetical protein
MTLAPIKHFLRKPAVILGEIAAIAVAGALGASLPELHVFQSPWFAGVTLLAAASLAVVVNEQFRRVGSQWRQPPSLAQFQSASFKTEFERPATTTVPQQKIWSERRLGLAGSLVFHTGLLLLIAAGAWRALFATDAVVDLIEGETLAPNAAWSAQWPGVFAKPLRLAQPITLESVSGRRYADGDLRELRAKFSAGEIAVNHQLHFGGSRLYLAQEFGPAALLEWNSSERVAALLAGIGHGNFAGEATAANGLKVFLRGNSERPARLEVRVMRDEGLLAAGTLGSGETLSLPDGASLTLRGVPMWARLHGSRDSALWLAFLGMILTMTGAAMIFTLIKLDFCLVVTPLGEREKVFVALKPQRFAPLFQERFEQLVHEQSEFGLRRQSAAATALSDGRDANELEKNLGAAEKRGRAALAPAVQDAAVARTAVWLLLASCLAFTSGCDRVSTAKAKQLVERYNQIVSEAYRRGDARLADPVVGPKEGKKLTGLIGVRLDLGLTLDSQMLSLEITDVEQAKNQLRVQTKEHWSYRDLRIGTGKQVGEASQDAYEMTYYFTNMNKAWLVDEIKFAAPPQVGRKQTPWIADRSQLPGATTPETKP